MRDVPRPTARRLGARSALLIVAAVVGVVALANAVLQPAYAGAPLASKRVLRPGTHTTGAAAPTSRIQEDTSPQPARAAIPSRRPDRRVRLEFAGKRLEFYGLAWFLLVVVLLDAQASCRSGPSTDESETARFNLYLFCAAAVSLGGVLWSLDQLSFSYWLVAFEYRLAIVCSAVIFVAAATSRHSTLRAARRGIGGDVRLVLRRAALWAGIATLIGVQAARPQPARGTESALTGRAFVEWLATQPRIPIGLHTADSEVVIVKFNDYQCPPCKAAELEYREPTVRLVRELGEVVHFVSLDLPLDSSCNKYVAATLHPAACAAAVSVRLARRSGRDREMQAWLWEHQATLSWEGVLQAAEDVGHVTDMREEYERVVREIQSDIELARQLGVDRTPTYFVNGIRLPFVGKAEFEAAIRTELRNHGRERAR
jgi:protein-disulfide isomerase